MIKRLAQHKIGFQKSGVSAADIGLINSTNIDLDSGLGTPQGMVTEDAFGVNVINNYDYDCLDPVVNNEEYDLGSL